SFVLALVAVPLVVGEDYRIHARVVQKGFAGEAAFFELVKWPSEPSGEFDATKAPSWDLKKLSKYVSADGIEFVDVNHVFEGHLGRKEILRGLKDRKGKVFQAFAHLSHIYSIPYKQYSELQFAKIPSGDIVVEMAGWYTLTFRHVDSQPVVVRWEYTQLE